MQYSIPVLPRLKAERLRYFLGSGHLGLTYLYEKNDYWFESPIAYYDALHGYAMKPGLESSRQPTPALTLHPACLRCHMSDVQAQADGSDNRYPKGPFLHVGITCESCHGETREHVASNGHTHAVNPAKLTPERHDSVCIVCHCADVAPRCTSSHMLHQGVGSRKWSQLERGGSSKKLGGDRERPSVLDGGAELVPSARISFIFPFEALHRFCREMRTAHPCPGAYGP